MARRITSKTGTTKRASSSRSRNTSPAAGGDATAAEGAQDKTLPTDPSIPEPDAAPGAADPSAMPGVEAASSEATAPDDAGAKAAEEPDATPTEDQPTADAHAPSETALSEGPAQMGAAAEATESGPAQDDTRSDPVATAETAPLAEPSDAADAAPVADKPSASAETKADDAPHPATAPTATPEKRGGFFPMLLGGAVAAGLGYGAHYFQTSTAPDPGLGALEAEVAQLRAAIAQGPDLSALESRIAALATVDPVAPVDLSPLEGAVTDLQARFEGLPDLEALQADVAALEAAPGPDLSPLQTALAALESAYAPLPEQIAALQQEMADLRALATAEVAEAEAAVDAARATAGLDRIRAAMVTGAPFADALEQLAQAGLDVPGELTAAADGVQTVEMLQDSFGAAARAAIAASLQTAPVDTAAEKLGNFFRAQIGARSLAPRDGDDADAITSRAGVAVAEGDLAAARSELSGLPETGLDAMSDWLNAVDTRLNAVAALETLHSAITTE